jgi:hypothetical protein
MSEQLQPPLERSSANFENGDYLALHESNLASYEQGRALSDATRVAESFAPPTPEQIHMAKHEEIAVVSKYVVRIRSDALGQGEFDLAA